MSSSKRFSPLKFICNSSKRKLLFERLYISTSCSSLKFKLHVKIKKKTLFVVTSVKLKTSLSKSEPVASDRNEARQFDLMF